MTTRVLLTGGGGAGTIEIVKSLKRTGDYSVVTADATSASAGFAFAERGYVIPFGAAEKFTAAFRDLIRRERPDFVIPLVDEEIPKVYAVAEESDVPAFRIVAPRLEFCAQTLDKWTMALELTKAGLPVADTWLASDVESARYPAIVKPRQGRGSRGLAFLRCREDLVSYLSEAPEPADRYIVQEQLIGDEYTTSVICTLDGTVLGVVPKQAVEKRGITQIGVTRQVPEIDTLGRAIQDSLRADGPFNVQLILDKDRQPRVFEINPRYSTTVALTLAAGVDEVDLVLRHAMGKAVSVPQFAPDLMMIRYTSQLYVSEAEWAPIDLRDLAAG